MTTPLLLFGCALMSAASACWFVGAGLYGDAARTYTHSRSRAVRLHEEAARLSAVALALTVVGGTAMLVALT